MTAIYRRKTGEEHSQYTHHASPRLAPTEPGQLDNRVDVCINYAVSINVLLTNTGKVFCNWLSN